MNKKLISTTIAIVCSLSMNAQSMKMVVDENGEAVGRYVHTNATTYTIAVQDDVEVPKEGLRVVTFSAANGQGIVYRKSIRVGNINVRKGPSLKSAVIGKITEPDGIPDAYPCLGKTKGWYKIRFDGKVGYVREDMVEWDGMCTF